MGIRLKIDRSARRVPLLDGAWLLMRPASSIEIAAAETAGRVKLDAAMQGIDSLKELGIPVPDASDLEDPHYALGVSRYVAACELAARLVTDWGGVFAESDGAGGPVPLAFDPALLPQLLLDNSVMRRFEIGAYAAQEMIVLEGKGSPLSPNGSPAGEGRTAGAVMPKASPARPAAAASTGRAARKSSTARTPRKA